ncbi:MAG: formyltransferase [Rhodocyclaceae bacterium]|nr:formyltransferase [Rhodocyclaceae bacterium]
MTHSPLPTSHSPARAVVFAYHNVGVRCLSVLLAHGVDVALVVTHEDSPAETIWFESVAKLAAMHDIPVITPADANAPEVIERIRALRPDFIFSFYYRQMLKPELLELASRGAYNMHGSLLPKYRGRVPVNWAIIRGEKETGATLHEMVAKPDAGAIIARQAVPILPFDTAGDVFAKVTVAAEMALNDVLPALLSGTAPSLPNDLASGSYFGGRKPEDGRIDWTRPATEIHNLIRAVAPPYPGAFTTLDGRRLLVLGSLPEPERVPRSSEPGLYVENGRCFADCGAGETMAVLRLTALEFDGMTMDASRIHALFGERKAPFN